MQMDMSETQGLAEHCVWGGPPPLKAVNMVDSVPVQILPQW